jgi:xylulokinase
MNQNEYLLTYDIGSTAVKLILFSRDLKPEYIGEKGVKTYQEDGLQYQKAEDWWDIVKNLTKKMFEKSSIKKDQIAAVAATGQMEDCLLLDASGEPLT